MPTLEQFTQPRAAPTPGSSPAFLSLPDFGGTYPITTTSPPAPLPNLPPPSAQRNTNRVSGFYGSDNLHNVILPHARTTGGGGGNTLDRVKAHSRKLSDTFRKTQLPSPADSVFCGQTTTNTNTTTTMMMTDEEVEMRCLVSYADENENEKKMFDEEEEEEEEGRKKKMMMMQRSIRDAKNSGDSF